MQLLPDPAWLPPLTFFFILENKKRENNLIMTCGNSDLGKNSWNQINQFYKKKNFKIFHKNFTFTFRKWKISPKNSVKLIHFNSRESKKRENNLITNHDLREFRFIFDYSVDTLFISNSGNENLGPNHLLLWWQISVKT